jgi:hypothetical protein
MSFSFCLNKNEMLTLCGLSLLYQGLDLKQEGKLMQDGQRLVVSVIRLLEKARAPGAADFKKLAASMISLDPQTRASPARSTKSPNSMAAPASVKSTPSPPLARQQIRPQIYRHGSATMSETDLLSQQEKIRRATIPNIMQRRDYAHGRTSTESTRSESPISKRDFRQSIQPLPTMLKPRVKHEKPPNLDYLSLSNTPVPSQPQSPAQGRSQQSMPNNHASMYQSKPYSTTKASGVSASEWEVLLGSLDGGQTNLYDAIYGGPALSLTDNSSSNYGDWSPDSQWDMTSFTMNDFGSGPGAARSVLSFSEESLSSGEDLSAHDLGMGGRPLDYRQALLPGIGSESYLLEGLDATFGL